MPIAVETMPSQRPSSLWARGAHLAGWLLLGARDRRAWRRARTGVGGRRVSADRRRRTLDRLNVGSLNLVQAITQRYLHPALWDPVIAGVLQWPAWSLLGGPGAALVLAFPWRRGA